MYWPRRANILGAHIDMKSRRMAPFAAHIAEALDRLIAEHAALDWRAPVCGALHV